MTGALIGAGSGLVLGLVLLVWALRERGKRRDAEVARDNAQSILKDTRAACARLQTENGVINKDRNNCRAQLRVLRTTISSLHEQLAECKDPAAVEKLLNDELGEQL